MDLLRCCSCVPLLIIPFKIFLQSFFYSCVPPYSIIFIIFFLFILFFINFLLNLCGAGGWCHMLFYILLSVDTGISLNRLPLINLPMLLFVSSKKNFRGHNFTWPKLIKKTNFQSLKNGCEINSRRALRFNDR